MLTQLVVRRANEEDLLDCARLVKEWMDQTVWLTRRHSFGAIKRILRDNSKQREIWVAGETIEAYCAVDPLTQHICALYCRNKGQGLGKALVDHAKRDRDCLTVNTHLPNYKARRFYTREGFKPKFEFEPSPPEVTRELRLEWRR